MKLPVDWAERMLQHYKEGAADVEICSELALTQKDFDALFNGDSAFQETVLYGRMLCKAWWYKQCRLGLKDKNFNTSLFYATMKNRFGWSDKVESATKDYREIDEMSEEELRTEIASKTKSIARVLQQSGSGVNVDIRELLNARSN